MLAGEVRLEVVARTRMNGRKEVGTCLHNYSSLMNWHFALGFVEGVRRRWSAIMTLCREDRLILFCWNGKAASFRTSAIFVTLATPSEAQSYSFSIDEGATRGAFRAALILPLARLVVELVGFGLPAVISPEDANGLPAPRLCPLSGRNRNIQMR